MKLRPLAKNLAQNFFGMVQRPIESGVNEKDATHFARFLQLEQIVRHRFGLTQFETVTTSIKGIAIGTLFGTTRSGDNTSLPIIVIMTTTKS